MADWRRKTRLFRACFVSNRLVCLAVSRPKCIIRHTGNEAPPPLRTAFPRDHLMDGRWSQPVADGHPPLKQRKISLY